MRPLILLGIALTLTACQGGRDSAAFSTRDGQTEASAPSSQDDSGDIVIDPVGNLLYPTGLGYRVDTVYGDDANAIKQTAYGVDGLPVGVDVDADSSTGNLLGADIQVHFFTLLLYGELTVTRLDGAPAPMPLKLEVSVIDPRNFLGLPGLTGAIDPDLRIALGMNASDTPARFHSQITVVDSLLSFLPRLTSANLSTEVEDANGGLAATLSMFADRGGVRADGLSLSVNTLPASPLELDVTLAPDSETADLSLTVSNPSLVNLDVSSFDGLEEQPEAKRDIGLELDQLDGQLAVELSGVDGLNELDEVSTIYKLITQNPLANLSLRLLDIDSSGSIGNVYAHIASLPTQIDVIQEPDGSFSMQANDPIGDIIFAQSENAYVELAPEFEPSSLFERHLIRQTEHVSELGTSESIQVRLGGLRSIQAQFSELTTLSAQLAAAPLNLYEEDDDGFKQAVIDQLPAEFSLRMPDTGKQLELQYSANAAGPGLHYSEQTTKRSTEASLTPLPSQLTLCSSSGDECGSHGAGTDNSLSFEASEHLTINYEQRSTDGRKQVSIVDLIVRTLQFDVGIRSGGKKGYVYFNTEDQDFSGHFKQINGDNGFELFFTEGSHAQDRYLRYDDYVRIKERSGSMICPKPRKLEIRASGHWIDADFILDRLCQ